MHVCFCFARRVHAMSTIRRHDTSTQQHLMQLESSSSFSFTDSLFSSLLNSTTMNVLSTSIFITTRQRFEILDVREENEATSMRKKIETRILERIKSRIKNESRTKKSFKIRLRSWSIIFCSNCHLRRFFRSSTSFKSSKSFSKTDSKSDVTTKSITKVVI
jgi:predicted nucleic-acid-binding Zn-ribbon protein